jgi:peptide/nickel transport system permease protein
VAAWRAFFLTYATEDYVELATAKGLTPRMVERRYLLRPTLPYILTSFSLTLLGFWQMTTALEYFFNWPGIGQAYVQAIQTSDVVVAVGIVVIFAYLLGLVVILLEVAYAMVDPRIRLGEDEQAVLRATTRSAPRPVRGLGPAGPDRQPSLRSRRAGFASLSWALRDGCDALRQGTAGLWALFRKLVQIPSAVAGLTIIAALMAMSVYAVAAVPRAAPITGEMVPPGEVPRPRNALPVWVNWFRAADLPATITLDTRNGRGAKEAQPGEGGTRTIRLTLSFDYPYSGLPEEMMLRLFPDSSREMFVSPAWIMPDGREIPLKARSVIAGGAYDISESIPLRYIRSHALRDQLRTATAEGPGPGGLPAYAVLFTDPGVEAVHSVRGSYTLQVKGVAFEPDADLDAQLILVGQVWGWAGTDDERGDLGAALLWGAPAALVIGLVGGIVTTLVSVVTAAAGAWFGGTLDSLIQRLTEATMVLPILAIAVILQRLFGFSLWLVMGAVVLVSAVGAPLKAYRAAFLQVKGAGYIEAAQAYGATDARIILRYMIPRIAPMVAPQLAILVPGFVFLEATLAIFGVSGNLPTWGNLIYRSLRSEVWQGNYLALIEPLALCLLAGLGFALLASPLDRILNPRLGSG